MKKYFTLLILSLSLLHPTSAQSISPQVIASNGVFATGGGYSLSYTTGQPASSTLVSGSSIVTQGFQQPNDIFTGLQTFNTPELNVQLYPNPASSEINLTINTTKGGEYTFQLVDLLGRVLQQTLNVQLAAGDNHFTFNVQQLPSSMYFITVHANSNTVVHSFKFNKIN